MIVVVGSPLVGSTEAGLRAAGTAAGIARAAVAAGAEVQIVGKVGEDPGGDAVLLDLAAAGVGHAAILRDPSRPTPAASPAHFVETALFDEPEGQATARGDDDSTTAEDGLSLEPADIELALRYLPDYRVLVVSEPLAEASLRVALAAARWNAAAFVVIVSPGSSQPLAGDDATVIEAPHDDPDDAFAGIIGAYAAAIDRGEEPTEAFATASLSLGWSAVAD
ncbi:MAG: PfkB family carbohydrate kinase [Candidatus Limnocylindrales bacterium]|nr:PfkB family carbohydrate kinase [Candidatus Limnocylindrales bacterium]